MKIGSSSSRSRRKMYNSFYNRNYKRNDFLKRHPEARSRFVAESYATAVTPTRASLSTVGGRAIAGTPLETQIQRFYVIEETTTIDLEAQSFEEILNEAEDGEILAIECLTNSPAITIEIVIYGLGNSPNIINNYSILEMVRRGRGMTPGEVETLPNGRAKDPSGMPLRYYPYVARYKDDDLIDYLDDERRYFVFRYEPQEAMPYSSIIVNVKNTSTEGGKSVDSINIHRRVYGNPLQESIAGSPIDSAEIFAAPQTEIVPSEQTAETAYAARLPVTSSPYITNYVQRQKELEELARMPEFIPSDEEEY